MNRPRAFPVKVNKEKVNANNENLKRGQRQQQQQQQQRTYGARLHNKLDQYHPYSQPQHQPSSLHQTARFNRAKKAESNDLGMPITACPAVTTLISRTHPIDAEKQRKQAIRKSTTSRFNNYTPLSSAAPASGVGTAFKPENRHPRMSHNAGGRAGQGMLPCKRDFVHQHHCAVANQRKEPPLDDAGRGDKRKKIKLANALLLPDKENKSFVYLCKPVKKVKELLSARTLPDSMEDLDELSQTPTSSTATLCIKRDMMNIQNEDQDQLEHQLDHQHGCSKSTEGSTTEEFELAPLLQVSQTSSSNTELSSARVFMNVRDLLASKQYELQPDDLDTIKDVVKTDMRYREMAHDDELFRDILRTQLQQIRKQETVVKSVLTSLEVQSDVEQSPQQQQGVAQLLSRGVQQRKAVKEVVVEDLGDDDGDGEGESEEDEHKIKKMKSLFLCDPYSEEASNTKFGEIATTASASATASALALATATTTASVSAGVSLGVVTAKSDNFISKSNLSTNSWTSNKFPNRPVIKSNTCPNTCTNTCTNNCTNRNINNDIDNQEEWIDLEADTSIRTSVTACLDDPESSGGSTDEIYGKTNEAKQKMEIDLVYESIPLLQREIQMLHALGEKLEKSLQASGGSVGGGSAINNTTFAISNACSNCVEKKSSSIFYTPFEFPEQMLQALDYRRAEAQISFYWSWEPIRAATSVVPMFGVRRCYGSIKEFRIEQKSLTEIKNADDNQWFYIPINDANRTELKRTSFKKLKENPDVLLQYLKPRDNVVAFNYFEHDPMFLQSQLFDSTEVAYKNRNGVLVPSETSFEHFFVEESNNNNNGNQMLSTKFSTIGDAQRCSENVNALRRQKPSDCYDNQLIIGGFPMDVNAIQHLVMQQLLKQQQEYQQQTQEEKECGLVIPSNAMESNAVQTKDAVKVLRLEKVITKTLRSTSPTPRAPSPPPPPPPPPPTPEPSIHAIPSIQKNQMKCMYEKRTRSASTPQSLTTPSTSPLPSPLPSPLSSPSPMPATLPLKGGNTKLAIDEDRLSGGKHNKGHLNVPQPMSCEVDSCSSFQSYTALQRPHRIRRTVTPLSPSKSPVEPKIHLLRTAIVGLVQISVFLLLIMAFTYPEARC